MNKRKALSRAGQWPFRLVTKCLLLPLLLSTVAIPLLAVPVTLAPVPKLQFFDVSGRPLSFGCVFSYKSGTTTALATYTQSNGAVQNSNPVILDAGGFAGASGSSGIWLQAGQAYTLKIVSAGGTHCALGTTQYTIDGIGGGLTLQTTVIPSGPTPSFPILAQNQLFQITLTGATVAQPLTAVGIVPPAFIVFQITQDAAGGHPFTWPANSIGGAEIGANSNQVTTQEFVWNGINATALGPGVTGTGPELSTGTLDVTGDAIVSGGVFASTFVSAGASPASSGVIRLANPDQLCWRTIGGGSNLCMSVDALDNFALSSGLAVTGELAVDGDFIANTSFQLNGSTVQTAIQGTDTNLLSSGTVSSSTGVPLCTDANQGATTTCTGSGPFFAPQRVAASGNVTVNSGAQTTVLTKSVTFPATPGIYRADVRYGAWGTIGSNTCAAEVVDATNNVAYALHGQDANGTGYVGLSGSEITAATYAAAAVVTFHLDVMCNATETITQTSGIFSFSPAESTYLEITPVLSN